VGEINIVIMVQMQEGASEVESHRIPTGWCGDILIARHTVHGMAKEFPFFRSSTVDPMADEIILLIGMERSVYNESEGKCKYITATREELDVFVNHMAEDLHRGR